MTKKYPSISRQSDAPFSDDRWLRAFEAKLQKGAVQSRDPHSLFDQINSIMNGTKSKYTSVQNAVDDMISRSGLKNYIEGIKTSRDYEPKKIAQQNVQPQNDKIPQVMQDKPTVMQTLKNIIRDSRGNMSIPAIIGKLRSLHSNDVTNDVDWDDEKLLRLVSQLNLQAKKDNPSTFDNYSTLGINDHGNENSDYDQSNHDAFAVLQPARG
jgi:hypothetical protein